MCKQKTTNCLQAQICATLLTHSASETEILCVLVVKLVVKQKTTGMTRKEWREKRIKREKINRNGKEHKPSSQRANLSWARLWVSPRVICSRFSNILQTHNHWVGAGPFWIYAIRHL